MFESHCPDQSQPLVHFLLSKPAMLTNLHGFVVPTVAAILGHAPAVQHHHGPRGVVEHGSHGVVETDQTQAALDHVQRVSVSRL